MNLNKFRIKKDRIVFSFWRYDIQHNDIRHNKIKHNDIQHNDIQRK
jgi:hypothetical protein